MSYADAKRQYERIKAAGARLDMSRGRPGAAQLALSAEMLTCLSADDCFSEDGTDCRNYGGPPEGIPEMRRLFAELLGARPDEVIVGGNSSLNMMFDCAAAFCHTIWDAAPKPLRFVCPVPGYDRHFAVCEYLGIEMLTVRMTENGPDLDEVEAFLREPSVVGMWCVPVFSNPQGYTYSDETIASLARLAANAAAEGFRVFWDDAYAVHSLYGEPPRVASFLRECEDIGAYDKALTFTSFSKISFPGAAVACVACSPANRVLIKKRLSVQTVGPDKLNQLRHARFFKDRDGVLLHMKKHADILRPRFELVHSILEENLAGVAVSWTRPEGGYFISFDTPRGCARRAVALCAEAGLAVTAAGATFPYGRDPYDSNIRIAPSQPALDALEAALGLFCLAVRLAAEGGD
jgi:DNA-binding transcriptional MocR family regulator